MQSHRMNGAFALGANRCLQPRQSLTMRTIFSAEKCLREDFATHTIAWTVVLAFGQTRHAYTGCFGIALI
jgi:hypothetical protein